MSDATPLDHINAYAHLIRGWEERVQEAGAEALRSGAHPLKPASGSPMDLDSKEMAYHFPAVMNALTQAVDHLATAVDLVEHGGELRVFSYPSLFRAALLGSSEAVWLMCPADRRTRVNRAWILSAEELRNHAAYAADLPDDPWKSAEEYRFKHRAELAELSRRGVRRKYEATSVIREAGQHVMEVMPDLEGFDHHAVAAWRLMSAQAHGRTWDKRYRDGYQFGTYADEARMSGNVSTPSTFAGWMMVPTTMMLAAWTLLDDGRRDAPKMGSAPRPE